MSPFPDAPLTDTQGHQPASCAACYPNWSHSQERCYLISLLKKRSLHELRKRGDQGEKNRKTWRLVLFSLEETTAWFPSENSPAQALWSAHRIGPPGAHTLLCRSSLCSGFWASAEIWVTQSHGWPTFTETQPSHPIRKTAALWKQDLWITKFTDKPILISSRRRTPLLLPDKANTDFSTSAHLQTAPLISLL